MVKLVPASEVDFKQFTAVLNRAYADYYVPLNMSVGELRSSILHDDVQLELSCAAKQNQKLVGLALLARRGAKGWIGGVGVIPAYRGRGVGRAIMDYTLGQARQDGIQQVQLEVITANERARRLYDSLNFKQRRLLHLAEGMPQVDHVSPRYAYNQVTVETVLAYHEQFHQEALPWQRSVKAMRALAVGLHAYVARYQQQVLAYAVGVFREGGLRYMDIAHMPGEANALHGLVGFLHQKYPMAQGSIVNISATDPAWQVLQQMNYEPFLSQHEMQLTF